MFTPTTVLITEKKVLRGRFAWTVFWGSSRWRRIFFKNYALQLMSAARAAFRLPNPSRSRFEIESRLFASLRGTKILVLST